MISHNLDCKTVRIVAYSSTREQSNKRSGTRLKTESETGERHYGRARLASFSRVRDIRHALPISLLILRKKTRLSCSLVIILIIINDFTKEVTVEHRYSEPLCDKVLGITNGTLLLSNSEIYEKEP